MDRVISRTITQPRLYLTLFGVFASLALTLAGVGLYGLVAYGVAQRTRELGIRTALGAARLIQQLLFASTAYDPLAFADVIMLLGAVALAACLIPTRRAARIDPLIALRTE